MKVRPVLAHEYDEVGRLTVHVYGAVLGESLSDEYRETLADVADRARHALVLVAVDTHDRLLGSVTYVGRPGPYAEFKGVDEAGVRMLVVAEGSQRQGVGRALVQACIDQARADARTRLSLHTTPTMTDAQRLYEGLGFRRAPERDWVPEDGISLLGYVLPLRRG